MDFSLKAIFGLDATGVKTELKQLRKETNEFINTWAGLGLAAAGAAFVALAKGAAEMASELKKSSLELGINVEQLQVLDSLALRNNESQETLRKALEKTRSATQEAAEGNKKLNEAFAKLGVNLTEIQRLPLEQKFTAIARGLVTAENKQSAYNAVSDIFGAKVGPQLLNSLTELGTKGFPAAAKAAQDAGHVMSAQTIVALEAAQSAIEEFKRKATIAVGSIIVNFRSEEGLKLLLYQFLNVVGQFGAGIVDAIIEGGGIIKAVFTGALKGVLNFYRDGFLDIIAFAAEQLNKIIPDWLKTRGFSIDVQSIDALKSAGLSIAQEITTAIAQTSPSTFKKDVAAYWDGAIQDQKEVVAELNKVDFGKEANKLTNAGKDIEGAAKVGADTIVDGAKKGAAELKQAAQAIYGAITRTGTPYESQSTAALQGVLGRLNDQYFDAKSRAPNASLNSPNGADYGAAVAMNFLQREIDRITAELNLRKNAADVASRYGEQEAVRRYGDDAVSRSLRDLQDTSERGTSALERISRGLATSGLIPPG